MTSNTTLSTGARLLHVANGTSTTGLIQAAGIPTVVFGPGGEGAHAVDEWVELASVDACAEGLVRAARELCA